MGKTKGKQDPKKKKDMALRLKREAIRLRKSIKKKKAY